MKPLALTLFLILTVARPVKMVFNRPGSLIYAGNLQQS